MNKRDLKIAIIGAGLAGLACAVECERQGVITDVFERSYSVGWIWPSQIIWMNVFERQMGDIRNHLRKVYHFDLKPTGIVRNLVLKSPNAQAHIEGKLGYLYARGKNTDSLENQLLRTLKRTPLHYNRPADYKELANKYDYVVVATGKDTAAKELGVWEDFGTVYIRGGVALGDFQPNSSTLFFNTEYAGHGYARLTPITTTEAVVALYHIGSSELEVDRCFDNFLDIEGLRHLEFQMKNTPPPFSTGRVNKFKVENILLAGRAAGLTERLTGSGGVAAMISGIMAARAIIEAKDYESLVLPLRDHIENISALRQPFEMMDNQGIDRLIATTGMPGIKHLFYNAEINFIDIFGQLVKHIYKMQSHNY